MKVESIRLQGIRCFDDTGSVPLGSGCNIFVGQNNAGKSTLLRGLTAWQIDPFSHPDIRPGAETSGYEITLSDVESDDYLMSRSAAHSRIRIQRIFRGGFEQPSNTKNYNISLFDQALSSTWPENKIVPFLAKRKTITFQQDISTVAQASVTGRYDNLYAKIDSVASPGRSSHDRYRAAVQDIVGVFITTHAAQGGKEAGFFFDDRNFVTLDRMGDGVAEMVALIVELSLAKGKVFAIEEPETNLHPAGLKALLALVRESSKDNQFLITTHSNIVVRELAAEETTKVFNVSREGKHPSDASSVVEVERSSSAHRDLLRELGYEFGDFDLHEGWIFLEESSAETIIREILIPWYAPTLKGRVRTFSAGGATNIEPTLGEFQRLITFVHLDPVYKDRIWIRADGDSAGKEIIARISANFPYLEVPRSDIFSMEQFEFYYPEQFADRVKEVLDTVDKRSRQTGKSALRQAVVDWSFEHESEARSAWKESAKEPIAFLQMVAKALASPP